MDLLRVLNNQYKNIFSKFFKIGQLHLKSIYIITQLHLIYYRIYYYQSSSETMCRESILLVIPLHFVSTSSYNKTNNGIGSWRGDKYRDKDRTVDLNQTRTKKLYCFWSYRKFVPNDMRFVWIYSCYSSNLKWWIRNLPSRLYGKFY